MWWEQLIGSVLKKCPGIVYLVDSLGGFEWCSSCTRPNTTWYNLSFSALASVKLRQQAIIWESKLIWVTIPQSTSTNQINWPCNVVVGTLPEPGSFPRMKAFSVILCFSFSNEILHDWCCSSICANRFRSCHCCFCPLQTLVWSRPLWFGLVLHKSKPGRMDSQLRSSCECSCLTKQTHSFPPSTASEKWPQ